MRTVKPPGALIPGRDRPNLFGRLCYDFTYWSSSQQTADMANHIDFADLGRQHYDDKDFPRRVRAVRAF